MIGGYDYVFVVDRVAEGFVQELTWQFFRKTWPSGMVETDSTEVLPLADSSTWDEVIHAHDLYFYTSAAAAQMWTELGAVEANRNQMVYVILDSSKEDGLQVTAVVSEPTDAMTRLLGDLRTNLQSECGWASHTPKAA